MTHRTPEQKRRAQHPMQRKLAKSVLGAVPPIPHNVCPDCGHAVLMHDGSRCLFVAGCVKCGGGE